MARLTCSYIIPCPDSSLGRNTHWPPLLDETPSSRCVLPTSLFICCRNPHVSLFCVAPTRTSLWLHVVQCHRGSLEGSLLSLSFLLLSLVCHQAVAVNSHGVCTFGSRKRTLRPVVTCRVTSAIKSAVNASDWCQLPAPRPPPTPIQRQSDALLACYCTHPSAPNVVAVSFCPTNTKTAGNE